MDLEQIKAHYEPPLMDLEQIKGSLIAISCGSRADKGLIMSHLIWI